MNIAERLARNETEGQSISARLQAIDRGIDALNAEKQVLMQQLLRLQGEHGLLMELSKEKPEGEVLGLE